MARRPLMDLLPYWYARFLFSGAKYERLALFGSRKGNYLA
jgi:hypothetical protein